MTIGFSMACLATLMTAWAPVVTTISTPVRVATWNIQEVGEPGTTQYRAAADILGRINADVVAINEVWTAADSDDLLSLASAAGYSHHFVAPPGPMGAMRSAVISKYPFEVRYFSAEELSGDPDANDITRFFIEATVDIPETSRDLVIVANHWKASSGDASEFRRAVESMRAVQIVSDYDTNRDAFIIMGDMNEELEDVPLSPSFFEELPGGLPQTFWLGDDLYDIMTSDGIDNDPFFPFEGWASMVDALQVDGKDITHPGSGARLDYMLVSEHISGGGVASEVYDSSDEWRGGGLAKFGNALPSGTSGSASDHLLVFADIIVSGTGPLIPVPKAARWN